MFCAPEILEGKSYDKSVDIFSLGVTLYYMMTRDEINVGQELLYNEDNALNHLGEKLRLSKYHPDLQEFVLKLLSLKPEERYTIDVILEKLTSFYDNLEDLQRLVTYDFPQNNDREFLNNRYGYVLDNNIGYSYDDDEGYSNDNSRNGYSEDSTYGGYSDRK